MEELEGREQNRRFGKDRTHSLGLHRHAVSQEEELQQTVVVHVAASERDVGTILVYWHMKKLKLGEFHRLSLKSELQ